jgi:hypothetical protein
MREYVLRDGEHVDQLIFGLLRHERKGGAR